MRQAFRGPLPSGSWAEITHCLPESGRSYIEKGDIWYYYSKGSGIYLYLGRTEAFCLHKDALRRFGIDPKASCRTCHKQYPALFQAARAAGVDTLQFMYHSDQNCGNMAIEIVDVRNGTTTCPTNPPLRRGWRASTPCECQRVHGCISCAATAEDDRYPPAWRLYPSPKNESILAWGGYVGNYSHF